MSVYSSMARHRRESIFQLNPNRPAKANFIITDLITNIEEVNQKSDPTSENQSSLKAFLRSHHVLNPTVILALILLGLATSIFSFFVEVAIQALENLRIISSNTGNTILDLGIWIIFCVILTQLSCFLSTFLSKDSQGSGIPEMKAILSGVKLKRFMSYRTLLTKAFGIILGIGGGLSIGKEGPFVHISGIFSHHISKLGIFSHIQSVIFIQNISLRNQFLASAVAAGVASVFQCPIGGVLYSIEVTSTYYIVSNMWRAAFCSIWCALGIIWLRESSLADMIKPTDFPAFELSPELLLFIVLGLLSGVFGAAFISVSSRLISLREHNTYPMLYRPYRYTLLIAVICAVVTFITPYLRKNDMTVINDMLHSELKDDSWNASSVTFALTVFFFCKLFLTLISLSCPLPAGVLYPLMTAGAVFGRLFENVVGMIVFTSNPGIYAAVGAASLVSATTHTISVTVIVFEITGQIHYFLPMIVSVLVSYSISNFFSMSIYDALLEIKGLPYLPSIKPSKLQSLTARDVMEYSHPQLMQGGTLKEVAESILEAGSAFSRVPVVDSESNLLYDLKLSNLKDYFRACALEHSKDISEAEQEKIKNYIGFLTSNSYSSVLDDSYQSMVMAQGESEEVKVLLCKMIDFSSHFLLGEDSPFAVNESTPLAKVHFLFIMLGFNQVYVVRKGQLVGMISRESFSKTRTN